jgi:hypothetical protein
MQNIAAGDNIIVRLGVYAGKNALNAGIDHCF